jgi:hypothetical protein
LVAGALQFYFTHYGSELGFDNEDLLSAAILDLYNAEILVERKFTAYTIDIGANRSTSSATPVAVIGATFQHTPEFDNIKIRCSNIALSNSVAGNASQAQITLEGESPIQQTTARNRGTTERTFAIDAVHEGVEPGVELDIGLQFWATGGTATMHRNADLAFIVEEWN